MKSNTSYSQLDTTRRFDTLQQLNLARQILLRTSLVQLMNQQIRNQKFLEAQQTKKKIDSLSSKELQLQKSVNRSRQQRQLQILQQSHSKQRVQFNQNWDQRMQQYQKTVKTQQSELFQRQAQSFNSQKQRLQQTTSVIPKYSSQYLNLKKMLQININKQNFQQAHLIKQQLQKIQQKQQQSFQEARNIKIYKQILQFQARQKLQIENFRKKAISGLNSLKRQKASELQSLIKRFKKMRQQIGNQQKLLNSKLDASRLPIKDKTAMAVQLSQLSILPDESCLEDLN